MDKTDKRNFQTGILSAIVCWIIMVVIAYAKFGNDLFTDNEHRFILLVFTPLWAVALGYCAYGIAKKWRTERDGYLQTENGQKEWKQRKWQLHSNACLIVGKVAAALFPVYLIAYMETSDWLASNPYWLAGLLSVACSGLLVGWILKKRARKER